MRLEDPNRSVRLAAAFALMWGLDVSREKWEQEFVAMVTPLLFDPSKKVRYTVSGLLHRAAGVVPIETVVQAIAREEEISNVPRLQRLLRRGLSVREKQ